MEKIEPNKTKHTVGGMPRDYMKCSMTGQEKGDLLIQVTA
jgi:hypothetical protein